ncbi:MAG TPA: tetratricopeptide repeat protein [Verrucomicrobiae bacterium]|jgi:tetratricopeptide (TPR) repeat protein|nr:tetratricopeptide repeat protein [Verrucomicrobiae bacterium]
MKVLKVLLRGPVLAAAVVLSASAGRQPDTRVVFPVTAINGRPAHLLLDTGSSSSVLFDGGAKRLGLKPTGFTDPVPITADGQTFTAPIPTFRFQTPWYFRLAFVRAKISADGLIGWPEVRDNILVFDADKRVVRSVDKLPPETAGWMKLKVIPSRWLLLEVPMDNGQAGVLEVDTGSFWAVEMPPWEWKQWKADHPKAPLTAHWGGIASFGISRFQVAWADKVKLGALTLTDIPVQNMPASLGTYLRDQAPDAKAEWAIGMYALMRMNLIVDGKNGWAYVHPKPAPGPAYPGVKRPNFKGGGPDGVANWTVADSVRLSGDSLYVSSGEYKWGKNDFAGALADYDHALALNPNNAEARSDRGDLRAFQGDTQGAIADCTKSIELNPTDPDTYSRRGAAREIRGDFSDAVADYEKVLELRSEDSDYERLYRDSLLWRLGRRPDDLSSASTIWKGRWTKKIGMFLAGKIDERSLLAAARIKDAEPVAGQKCEAWYYIGMFHLSKGDKDDARVSFRASRAVVLNDYDEYRFAGAELARLDAVARR